MKLLFVTGGGDCECRGKGVRGLCVKDFEEQKPTYIYALCKCVVAKEATVETFKVRLPQRNIEAGQGETVPVMVHKVVPKKEDFHMVMRLKLAEENESEPSGS